MRRRIIVGEATGINRYETPSHTGFDPDRDLRDRYCRPFFDKNGVGLLRTTIYNDGGLLITLLLVGYCRFALITTN